MGSQVRHYVIRNQSQVELQQVMYLIIYVFNVVLLMKLCIRWGFLALLVIVILIIFSWFGLPFAPSPIWEWLFWAQETLTPKSTHEDPLLPLKQVWVKAQYLSMQNTGQKEREPCEFVSDYYFISKWISADLLCQYNSATANYVSQRHGFKWVALLYLLCMSLKIE